MSTGKNQNTNFEYTQCNTGLENVEKETAIAVTMNSKLNFEQHMSKKTNKANIIMGLIRRTLICLDEEILLLLYKALVRLECVNTIWNPYKIKDIRAIQNVQRRATKAIPPLRNMWYEEQLTKP